MERRTFLTLMTGSLALPAFGAPKGGIIDLRWFRMRNSSEQQMRRTSEFIEKHGLPAVRRAGISTVGAFTNLIAPEGPFILLASSVPSMAAFEEVSAKLGEDKEYRQALAGFYSAPGLAYERSESSLLRAIDSMPGIESPPVEQGKPARVFELRTYESDNPLTLMRKVKMFEDGELAIFRKVGMRTVFFGITSVGRNQPNLTYMLGYDDLAHREKCWTAFGSDADWKKLRATPGLSDAEVVSNISSMLLRPLAFSSIR